MRKIFLLILTLKFTTNVYAHSTKNLNFDSKANCSKKRSMLYGISKLMCEKLLHEYYLETSINTIISLEFSNS